MIFKRKKKKSFFKEDEIFVVDFLLVFIVIAGMLFLQGLSDKNCGDYEKTSGQVCFKNNCFVVELAVTPGERERGLMFREHLDTDKGMLFIFKEEGIYSFWMKNTYISLDIIWINKDKQVVYISKNIPAHTDELFASVDPGKKAKYVLEINAGIVERIGLGIGDELVFSEDIPF